MADKTLLTRIINKHDSLAKWNSSTIVLKEGEIALAYVETQKPDGHGGFYTVPTYLMKVGTGNKTFSQLEWLAAPASDVYEWAKKATAAEAIPELAQIATNKSDITALDGRIDALEGLVGGNVGELITAAIEALDVTDTAVAGQFVTAVSEADGKISVTRAALKASDIPALGIDKITGLQDKLDDIDGALATVDERIATAKSGAEETAAADATAKANAAQSAAISAAATDATTKANKALADAKAYADGLASNYDAAGSADDALESANSYTDGKIAEEVTRANGAYDAKGAAAAAEQAAKDYADDIKADLLGNSETLVGTYDTLKEIDAWIRNSGVDATELSQAIATETTAREEADAALAARIVDLEAVDHTHANKSELDLIATGDKSKWDTAAGKAHEHANKTVLDGIDAAKVAAWDAAEQNAKSYADGKAAEAQSAATTAAAADAKAKIEALDVTVTGMGAGKTLATLTETDGKIAATFQNIQITKSQVTDFKDSDYDAAGSATAAETNAKAYAKDYTDAQVKTVSDKVDALTTDDIAAGAEIWIFDCGTSSTVIE